LCTDIPELEVLMKEINDLSESGARYTEMPHVIEITLPMLCNYLPRWWERGSENLPEQEGQICTAVTSEQLNQLLGSIMKIVVNNLGIDEASWMKRLAVFAQPIVSRAKPEMLKSHFIPTMEKLKKRAGKVVAEEEHLRMEGKSEVDSENGTIRDEFAVLCRDLYALYPLLIRYNFKREEQNFVVMNEINNMSFLTADSKSKMSKVEDPAMRWQMALYKEMAGKAEDAEDPEKVVKRVQEVSAVLYHIEVTEHPFKSKKMVWHKLLSKQRRRAVVACFRMTPLYNIPK
ncbi:hypothetical protein XENOCAPTIV_018025, partial [Xenoophorus captivus]